MTRLVKCDLPSCERVVAEEGRMDWLVVERDGIDNVMLGEVPGPWHYCSWEHVARAALLRSGEGPAPP